MRIDEGSRRPKAWFSSWPGSRGLSVALAGAPR